MKFFGSVLSFLVALAIFFPFAPQANGQGVKRLVQIKIDGLPTHYVDRFVREKDPATGKSVLPWIEEVFYKNGTRVPNFYTRGTSLSGPSWGQLDTGQPQQIKGNVEYDRYTGRAYDYLNFIPYYVDYGLWKKADMPAVEVMDQLGIPILADAFAYERRYTSQQLYQRGNNWEVLASGVVNLYPGTVRDFIDEWTIGLNFRKVTVDQAERDILGKLVKRPDIDFFDYYDVSFDHVSHHNNDTLSRLNALKDLDKLIGGMWAAITASSRADETALVLVSDHGFNSDETTYSQGYNLVDMLGSEAGGGHHVVTKRRLMLDYSLKGVYPFVPVIKTKSDHSFYLRGQTSEYPTALLDFDGNERSSLHLRNSDLNVLHILLQQLKMRSLKPEVKRAATEAFFEVIDSNRTNWRRIVSEMSSELDALARRAAVEKDDVERSKRKFTEADKAAGDDKAWLRRYALNQLDLKEGDEYRRYIASLSRLLALDRSRSNLKKIEIADVIAPGAMGEPNSLYQLQNYVVGPGREGLVLDASGKLDLERSFVRVNYFDLLHEQRVKNNVQRGVSNRPVDFVAVTVDRGSFPSAFRDREALTEDPVWLFGGRDHQALILVRKGADGQRSYRYVPVRGLKQDAAGRTTFEEVEIGPGFPLRYYEDDELAVPLSRRAAWFGEWHSEQEWMEAIHRTKYSIGLIAANEQLQIHAVPAAKETAADTLHTREFRQRQRDLTKTDLQIVANDHWNFDVRGFNPGGNHGSFLRVSSNSVFMVAGGSRTGIPRGLVVEKPYDSLSMMPTLMRLMGKIDEKNEPDSDLKARGFYRFPGRVITEITEAR